MAQIAAAKMPEWPSYDNFGKITQNPHFLKKCKGGIKGNFSKIAQKVALPSKGQQHSGANIIILLLYPRIMQRLKKSLAQKAAPKLPEWPSYGNFGKVTQDPHFLKKCKGGTNGNFFKNRPKSSPRLKGPKALWRNRHYPLIRMHLNCKDWRRFRHKQRLQMCRNGQVMAIFARSPKTRIFRKSAKGRPREVFQKSPKK